MKKQISRRDVLKGLGLMSGAALAACAAPAAPPAAAPTVAPAMAATAAPAAATTAPAAAPAATAVPAPTITPVPAIAQPAGSLKLSFWYGLGGSLGNVVRQVVNKYNESQSKYYVDAIFQASYDDTINKINASLAGGELPNIVQVFDAGTQRMIDTKRIIPVQGLVERDKMQAAIDDIEPAPRSYYTVGGTLYSMPFNTSTAMTYINKSALKEAGLDANKTIWTYSELLDAAKKMNKEGRKGFAVHAGSWFMEQQLSVHQQLLIDPENGRTGRGTKYVYNGESGVKWLEFLKSFVDAGVAKYYANSGEAQAAFVKGEAAIHLDSIAALRGITGSVAKTAAPFDVGAVYMPRRDGATVGRTIIGGASLWLTDSGTKDTQEGAWDFVKFCTTPELQAFWSANTGYYPIRKAAYDLPDMKAALEKYPQFNVAIEQIRSAPLDVYNSGGVSGTFVPMRLEIQKAMDAFWTGKTATAQAALDEAVKKTNEQLDEYNSTVKA